MDVFIIKNKHGEPVRIRLCWGVDFGHLYHQSSWGWNELSKKLEFGDPKMNYIVAFEPSIEATDFGRDLLQVSDSLEYCGLPSMQDLPWDYFIPVGFTAYQHTQEEINESDVPVIYCFEVQVQENHRGLGIGCYLMNSLVSIGKHEKRSRVLLTCFRDNVKALRFYRKLGFSPDETSPSLYLDAEDAKHYDYEILSFKIKV